MPQRQQFSRSIYRSDIDGLRAVAVMSVVIFHAFPNWLRGGFIGVDVFFVISGYLISKIIFESLDDGTFSLSEFYFRRIRRIFPALIFVLLICSVLGWVSLFIDEFNNLGKHIVAGAIFISNFVFWNEEGYFNGFADSKPLLHLWSLSIEEQFYIVWPLLLLFLRGRKFVVLAMIVFITISSFMLNIEAVGRDPSSAFYFPQNRFWELSCGSLLSWVALYRNALSANIKNNINILFAHVFYKKRHGKDLKILANIFSFSGLLLLVCGFLQINKELSFPGKWGLIPVLGSVMIIVAGPKAFLNRTILSNKIFVWFGLISFPLYLWHWPLLSFLNIIESGSTDYKMRIAVIALSVALAWFTYRFVELPMRFGGNQELKVMVLAVLMFFVCYVGFKMSFYRGPLLKMNDRDEFVRYFENSFPDWKYLKKFNLVSEFRLECGYFNYKKYLEEGAIEGGVENSKPVPEIDPSCYKVNPRFDKKVLIWGDSHAQSLHHGIAKFIPSNWQVMQIASSGCEAKINVDSPSTESQCAQTNYFAMKTIKEAVPEVVVIAQVMNHSSKVMDDIFKKLKTFGVKKVLFLGPVPQWRGVLPKIFVRKLWNTKPRRTYVGINKEILDVNKALLREFSSNNGWVLVDVIGLFCNAEGCLTYTGDDIKESFTTWDYGHLTPIASEYLAQHLLIDLITKN